MIRTTSYNWGTRSLGAHMQVLRTALAEQTGTVSPLLQAGPAHGVDVTSQQAYSGSIIDPNTDWVIMAANGAPSCAAYNPVANTITNLDPHGEGAAAFSGIVLVNSTLAVLLPSNADYFGFIDLPTLTYRRGPAHNQGQGAFGKGGLSESGYVVAAPRANTSHVVRLDPIKGELVNLVANPALSVGFSDAVPLDDNWFLLIPDGPAPLFKVDAKTGELIEIPGGNLAQCRSGMPLPDGRAVITPFDLTRVLFFSMTKNTSAIGATISANTDKWGGVALATNGDAIFPPWNFGSVLSITPKTRTFATTSAISGTNLFSSALAMPDKRIFFTPARATAPYLYTHMTGDKPLPRDVLLSRFYNRG